MFSGNKDGVSAGIGKRGDGDETGDVEGDGDETGDVEGDGAETGDMEGDVADGGNDIDETGTTDDDGEACNSFLSVTYPDSIAFL